MATNRRSPKPRPVQSVQIGLIALCIGSGLMLTACGSIRSMTANAPVTVQSVGTQYADLAYVMYDDAYLAAVDLQAAIQAFTNNPSNETLTAAKQAWIKARQFYSITEGFRFYEGPIDGVAFDNIEVRINAWPIDEQYIDYIASDASAGIMNDLDTYPTFNATTLMDRNNVGGEKNISTGFHAIEFLLWGQDLSSGPGGGTRPYTDYLDSDTASNQSRRRDYLRYLASILVNDLAFVRSEWAATGGNYRDTWNALPATTRLANMINGIGVLSGAEMAVERLIGLDTQDKEEEQSCFSDTTRDDYINNVKSLQAIYYGKTTRYNGSTFAVPSLYALAKNANPDLAETIHSELNRALATAQSLQDPFDQEFLSENPTGRSRLSTMKSHLVSLGANLSTLSTQLTGQGVVGDGD